jgi:hypothetical protein
MSCSTLTTTSVLASLAAMLAIGSAPSAAAAAERPPSSLASGYATARATHVHHGQRAAKTRTATKQVQAVESPASVPLEQREGNHPFTCGQFTVNTQGHPTAC